MATSRSYGKQGSLVDVAALLDVLCEVGQGDGASLARLCELTGRSRATVFRLLADAGTLGVTVGYSRERGTYRVEGWGLLRRDAVLRRATRRRRERRAAPPKAITRDRFSLRPAQPHRAPRKELDHDHVHLGR